MSDAWLFYIYKVQNVQDYTTNYSNDEFCPSTDASKHTSYTHAHTHSSTYV